MLIVNVSCGPLKSVKFFQNSQLSESQIHGENLAPHISCDLRSSSPQPTWVDTSTNKCFSLSLTFVASPPIMQFNRFTCFLFCVCRKLVHGLVSAQPLHALRWSMVLPAMSLSNWLIDSLDDEQMRADYGGAWEGWECVDPALTVEVGNGNCPGTRSTSNSDCKKPVGLHPNPPKPWWRCFACTDGWHFSRKWLIFSTEVPAISQKSVFTHSLIEHVAFLPVSEDFFFSWVLFHSVDFQFAESTVQCHFSDISSSVRPRDCFWYSPGISAQILSSVY